MKLSWIIAPRQVMKHITDTKTQYDININTVQQLVADELFASGAYDEYLEEYTPRFIERLALCRMLFEHHFGGTATWSVNAEGFYQWLEFGEGINTYGVLKMLRNTFVHSGFFFNPVDTRRLYINPMGGSMQNLDSGLREISEIVKLLLSK
jgi:DNA-binding transcriptional MocR family regulator